MREISLFILIIGIIFITIGYTENKLKKVQEQNKEIEYRLVPKSIYDEQIEPTEVLDKFSKMFAESSPGSQDYSNVYNSEY
jgi:hypothetical protein